MKNSGDAEHYPITEHEAKVELFRSGLREMGLDPTFFPEESDSLVIFIKSLSEEIPASKVQTPLDRDPVTSRERRMLMLLNVDGALLTKLIDRYQRQIETEAATRYLWPRHESLLELPTTKKLSFLRAVRTLQVVADRVCLFVAAKRQANNEGTAATGGRLDLTALDRAGLDFYDLEDFVRAVKRGQPVRQHDFLIRSGTDLEVAILEGSGLGVDRGNECVAEAFLCMLELASETIRTIHRCRMPRSPKTRLEYLLGIGQRDSDDCGRFYIPQEGRSHCGKHTCEKKAGQFADVSRLRNVTLPDKARNIAWKCYKKHSSKRLFDDLWDEALANSETLKDALIRFCRSQKPPPF